MKRLPLFTSLLCFLVLRVYPASAQISGETVILSERVGEIIDSSESERFHVYQNIRGLKSARVVVTSDSLFYVVVEITQRSSPPRVEYLKYSLTVLKVIAEKINHIEGLIDGTYVMGTEPARLRTAAGFGVVERPPLAQAGVAAWSAESQAFARSRGSLPAESLPFSQTSASLPVRARYPQFGFAGGAATYKPDAGGVWGLLGVIEEHYRRYGYPVDHKTPDDSRPLAVCFSATVVVSPLFDVSLDVIQQDGFVKYKSVGLRGRYFPAELDFGPLRLFGSAGFQLGWYSISSVCQYYDQIGPRDSVGRYRMFVLADIQGAERVFFMNGCRNAE